MLILREFQLPISTLHRGTSLMSEKAQPMKCLINLSVVSLCLFDNEELQMTITSSAARRIFVLKARQPTNGSFQRTAVENNRTATAAAIARCQSDLAANKNSNNYRLQSLCLQAVARYGELALVGRGD